jgi:predicted GNAT family acetyltransferase
MKNLFSRSKAPPGQASMVKGWVTERFGLSDADLVSVAELACHEPGCQPIETVVTVHGADGQRRTWRLHKPVAEITAADVEALEAHP